MKKLIIGLMSAGVLMAACGTEVGSPEGNPNADPPAVAVTAAFYPLAYAANRIGADRVRVTDLVPPGAHAHDLELTPKANTKLDAADLVITLGGFQPAVDAAAARLAPSVHLDLAGSVELSLPAANAHDHDHDHKSPATSLDPHFWLDPTRYAQAVQTIADRLAEIDPEGAAAYGQGATDLLADLSTLDHDFSAALQNCRSRELVTSHAAFGYLADRYQLDQRAIAGLTPDLEPGAKAVRDLVTFVRDNDVQTVYAETLINRSLTDTIARESGAKVAVLDPIESVTTESAGTDYLEIMRANLRTLAGGQECT